MGLQYSVFKLPIETNAIELDGEGLTKCINSVKQNSLAGSSTNQQNNVTNCIIDNVRVRMSPSSSEYLPIQYLGPAPQIDKDGNIITKLDYILPEPTNCMKALENAQKEPFDTEKIIYNKTNDNAMPIIVIIVIIIIIFLIKK